MQVELELQHPVVVLPRSSVAPRPLACWLTCVPTPPPASLALIGSCLCAPVCHDFYDGIDLRRNRLPKVSEEHFSADLGLIKVPPPPPSY